MAIRVEREIARADLNDEFGVSCWQESQLVELTTDQAREYAEEILRAADQADAIELQDRDAAIASEIDGAIVHDGQVIL